MVTQRPLTDFFRGRPIALREIKDGLREVFLGFNDGARSMIGIAIATGTAGIIVGGITLTGLGFRMTEFVEFVSMGNVHGHAALHRLRLPRARAWACRRPPTTSSWPPSWRRSSWSWARSPGLVIPLIAVHLFVFYYGIMGDITPPVGLASFAAAAISGEDPIQTGIQGSVYALRTVVLPFVWIFNPQLLLIDVHGWWELFLVVTSATVACLIFAAATMG